MAVQLPCPGNPTNAGPSSGTEIRHLEPNVISRLSNILDLNDSWKELACAVPHPDVADTLLLCSRDISALEEEKLQRNCSPTRSLLSYWGTFGRNRPTVQVLLDLLTRCGLIRAAHFLTTDVLGQVAESMNNLNGSLVSNPELLGLGCGIPHYEYLFLKKATEDFSTRSVTDGGNLLGEGAFGAVFLALVSDKALAVKKLKEPIGKQFITEIQALTRFEHPNLLPLLGYSVDGPSSCLVYEYLSMGCLEQHLADVNNPLLWTSRLSIALGTARGIEHLHVSGSKPLVHRDVKSANILLDKNLIPKLGDFGLARLGSAGASTTAIVTNVISGTNCYMAPEAFRGDVSTKMDVFSYGVVLLELLTGLPPYDPNREDRDLLSHVQESCVEICNLLDGKAGLWNTAVADSVYKVSVRCTKDSKRDRPAMTEVVQLLEELCSFLP